MVRALRVVSVERGLDPRDFALAAFGGAGGMHGCSLAEELGMRTVLVPRASGVLSALGLAISDLRRDFVRPLLGAGADLEAGFAALEREAGEALPEARLARRADARYKQQAFELTVDAGDEEALVERFHAAHEQRYGYAMRDQPVELVSLRLVATVPVEKPALREEPATGDARTGRRHVNVDGGGGRSTCSTASGWGRAARSPARRSSSWPGRPASCAPAGTAAWTPPGRSCWSGGDEARPRRAVRLSSALSGIAEEMGAVLIRGAYSSNIKERRDCSTALFDAAGNMFAQAEHIPVHLGAMPEAVAAVMEKEPRPGDVFAVNDPFSGGTHLPDVTLVSPMALDGEVAGFAVTRAHHSDVGGVSPGSMPSGSRELLQEGLVIPPLRIVCEGEPLEDVLELILANVRTPQVRRGDLRAQIAANRLAEVRLAELVERRGRADVDAVSRRSSSTPSAVPARRCARCPTARRPRSPRSRATAWPTRTSRSARRSRSTAAT